MAITPKASNSRTGQLPLTGAAWASFPAENFLEKLLIVAHDGDAWVCIGHASPAEAKSMLVKEGSGFAIEPVPTGPMFLKASGSNHTVYYAGS